MGTKYFKGRGAQYNPANPFAAHEYVREHWEGIDEDLPDVHTKVFFEYPRKVVNQVDSPDLGFDYSLNPYQGCEHGCAYCYARNSHQYWGFNAGLDFESRIVVKPEAPKILEQQLLKKNWVVKPIMISGNTDCYQPLEKKFQLTRKILEVCLKYRHPVGLITKNSLITRDIDLLGSLAELKLVKVMISVTTLAEKLRLKMEPRTATAAKRMEVINKLSAAGIPCGVMVAPIIPGLTDQEIPAILKTAAEEGARTANYTILRLNGHLEGLFTDWLSRNYPDRKQKVINQVKQVHGGKVNDSEWGRRLSGEGPYAEFIARLFKLQRKKYFKDKKMPEYEFGLFRGGGVLKLF